MMADLRETRVIIGSENTASEYRSSLLTSTLNLTLSLLEAQSEPWGIITCPLNISKIMKPKVFLALGCEERSLHGA